MFLDASAIVGILTNEAEAAQLKQQIDAATTPFFSSPLAIFEATAAIVRKRAGQGGSHPMPDLLEAARVSVMAFLEALGAKEIIISADIGRKALAAAGQYGKIAGHKASLNLGDCFAYACAKAYRTPLLYKGNDFIHTDLG